MYALIREGGKQYRVQRNSEIQVESLPLNAGDRYETTEVLLVGGEETKIGTPLVDGAKVVGTVVNHGRAKKIRVFKYKAKVNYRRRIGHRQNFTTIRINEIVA